MQVDIPAPGRVHEDEGAINRIDPRPDSPLPLALQLEDSYKPTHFTRGSPALDG